MDTIETNIQLLIWSIKKSPEYKEYKKCEAQLNLHPELWPRVDEFCTNNFRLQNDVLDSQLFEALNKLAQESEELRKIPQVNAYLQAELNLCRMLQGISLDIYGGLDIHIPIDKERQNE